MEWYYVEADAQRGPVSDYAFEDLVQRGVIRPETLVWNASMTDWRPYRDVGASFAADHAGAFVPAAAPIPVERTEPLAIASFVLSIVSLFTCIVLVVPGVICGHVALGRINASGGALAGRAFALAGLVIGYGILGLTAIVFLVVLSAIAIS